MRSSGPKVFMVSEHQQDVELYASFSKSSCRSPKIYIPFERR
jgi:hypothetical protein